MGIKRLVTYTPLQGEVVAYLRKSSGVCVSECAGIHARVIIRIMLVFPLCEMANHDSQSQNVRLSLHILEPIECTHQFLLEIAHLSVQKKSKTHQRCCDNYNTVMQILPGNGSPHM